MKIFNNFLILFLGLTLQHAFAQSLYSGDKVAIQVRGASPKYLMYYKNGGAVRLSPNKMSENNAQFSTTFTIEKIDGRSSKIAQNDKVYIKAGNNYLNSYDSNGALSTKNSYSENPAISDEIFTIRFIGGNTISPIAEFITRRNLKLGVANNKPTTLPIDNRSDDGSDALLMARLDNFSLVIIESNATQNSRNQSDRGIIYAPPVTETDQAIYDKYKAMGWDKDGHSEIRTPPKHTAGGNGYVKYYSFNNEKTAIYHFPNRGTFAMNAAEMRAYDAAGQDKFAYVASDPKPCGAGCGYNDVIMTHDNSAGVLVWDKWVYGSIYAKYKELNRWNGPLGHPTTSELNLNGPTKGRYNAFSKGQIYWTPSFGPTAFWGKVMKMYEQTGWDTGWLGLPTQSCNPKSNKQVVVFERGSIDVGNGCDSYNNKGYYTDVTGKVVGGKPCY